MSFSDSCYSLFTTYNIMQSSLHSNSILYEKDIALQPINFGEDILDKTIHNNFSSLKHTKYKRYNSNVILVTQYTESSNMYSKILNFNYS